MNRKQKIMLLRILSAAALTLGAFLLPTEGPLRLGCFLLPYFLIGYDVLWEAACHICRGRLFDEQFLMAVATVGAFAIGEYPEAAAVMLFYQVGEWFQGIAVGKSRRSIASLMAIRPEVAVVLREGGEEEVDPEDVAVGERILVRPGERIPLDGIVLSGQSALQMASLTGESLPKEVEPGDAVLSGAINQTGALVVQTTGVYEDSTVARILSLVENAYEKKAKSEAFITRFSRYYTPAVVGAAALLALIPPLFWGGWLLWLERALTFLVVSCPCALVVSVPLSFFGGIGGAAREGMLFKGANHLEALAKVDTLCFDKTGTVTKGEFALSGITPVDVAEEELLSLAALLESRSSHPIARSILAAHPTVETAALEEMEELPGKGVRGVVKGDVCLAGSERFLREAGLSPLPSPSVGSTVHVAKAGKYLGYLLVEDEGRPGAKEALSALYRAGISHTVLLTGDAPAVGKAVGEALGIKEVQAGLLPGDKVRAIEGLLEKGRRVAFVGDGINDAPALTRSDVGIAMGGVGSDAAIEAADLVLMEDDPRRIPLAIRHARRTLGIVKENVIFALGIKLGILALSAFGYANMWMAVFGDVGVLILATLNAMRAMAVRKKI